jgi:hypothetical protein
VPAVPIICGFSIIASAVTLVLFVHADNVAVALIVPIASGLDNHQVFIATDVRHTHRGAPRTSITLPTVTVIITVTFQSVTSVVIIELKVEAGNQRAL